MHHQAAVRHIVPLHRTCLYQVLPAGNCSDRLWLFVLSGLIGTIMSIINSHTVGVPMEGPGLPMLNWSTRGGDLRVSHCVSLYGLQWLQLLPVFLKRNKMEHLQGRELIKGIFFTYPLFSLFPLVHALLSIPFWSV